MSASPWAGVKFICENPQCLAEYQLEATDKCQLSFDDGRRALYDTPPCFDCGRVSNITIEAPNDQLGGA